VFAKLTARVHDYAGLDYKAIGAMGRALAPPPDAAGAGAAFARA